MHTTFRTLLNICLALVVLACLSGFAPLNQDDPAAEGPTLRITQVDTSQFPKVVVYVSVTDAAGEPVGVSPSRLVLKENGVPITPDAIGGSGDVGPLTTMLVIDISGSMNSSDKLKSAKNAATAYVDQSRPGDQIGVLAFNTDVEYVQPITTDLPAVTEAIAGLKAEKDTAMYDALSLAMEYLKPIQGRKAVIVLSDGLDNRSKITGLEVLERVNTESLSISTIGLGDPTQSKSAISSLDEVALKLLAERAGGAYGFANDAQSLQSLYERYGRALQSEYVISYTSPSQLHDGVNRALSVSLTEAASSEEAAVAPVEYNPGGLVPEVSEPATWGVFLAVLGVLALLLVLPMAVRMAADFFRSRSKPGGESAAKTSRVKLKS
jgi:VWFA-related protein